MLLRSNLHFKWMGKELGEVNFVARSPEDLPKCCLFLCEPCNYPSWVSHYSQQQKNECAPSFSACNCALVKANMAMFILPGEQVRHEVPFVQAKNNLLSFPKSQRGWALNLEMRKSVLPRKGSTKLPRS